MTIDKFWEYIKSLENRVVYTLTKNEINTINLVEDTGRMSDRVIIEQRESFPTREDLWAAYQRLTIQKKLNRIPDLEWLKEKRVSSIVFAILSTMPNVSIQDAGKNNPTLLIDN
jgi:hypothetical protein